MKNPLHVGEIRWDASNTVNPSVDGAISYVSGTGFRMNIGGTNYTIPTSASAGASTALDNLASVAINTSLVSDTDSTDDLGSSSIYWANSYIDKMYVNATAYIDGATGGTVAVSGILTVSGASTLTGNVSAGGDLDVAGTLSVGTFATDAVAASTTNADLTLDGNGTGGVDICSTSTGGITLGDDVTLASGKSATFTAGSLTLTDGDIVITEGKITVDSTVDETSYIKRNQAATTGVLFELEETNAAADNITFLIDSNATGAVGSMQIDHEGTADCLTITSLAASASLIKATAEAATGTVLEAISAASSTVAMVSVTNGGTGATGWLGADGVGQVHIVNDGNLAHANASSLLIEYSGTGAATGLGTSIRVVDTGATATSYAVYISAATGEALFVDSGTVRFDETVQLGVDDTGADLILYGATANKKVHWDESEDKLYIADDTYLGFGGAPGGSDGVVAYWDDAGSSLDIDAVNANETISIGTNTDTDVVINTNAGAALTIDASADSLTVASTAILQATGTGTGDGLVIPYHATNSPSDTTTGSIFFEIDASKLWVYTGVGWVGTVLA